VTKKTISIKQLDGDLQSDECCACGGSTANDRIDGRQEALLKHEIINTVCLLGTCCCQTLPLNQSLTLQQNTSQSNNNKKVPKKLVLVWHRAPPLSVRRSVRTLAGRVPTTQQIILCQATNTNNMHLLFAISKILAQIEQTLYCIE